MATKLADSGNPQLNNLDQNVKTATLVLLVMVGGAMFAIGASYNDYLAMKQATYQSLKDTVQTQNTKIDFLSDDIEDLTNIVTKLANPPTGK